MTEKKQVKIGELLLIAYLTISTGLGLFITISLIWLKLQFTKDSDPNPNVGFIYILLIIPQILGIATGVIIWLRHLVKKTSYMRLTLMPLILWILSAIMYFVI